MYLPPVIMLVAGAISVALPFVLTAANNNNYWYGFIVSVCIAYCGAVVHKVKQFSPSASEEAFLISIILCGVSYLMPTVVFVLPIMLIVLLIKIETALRTIIAAILGLLAIVAIYFTLIVVLQINCPWATFFAKEQFWGWIPVGGFSIAWIAITILRRTLRVR